MCKKVNYCNTRIDKCIRSRIKFLQDQGIKTVSSCCGHGRYPLTIVVKSDKGIIFELLSGKVIPRKKRFYVKDNKGYYYRPEWT